MTSQRHSGGALQQLQLSSGPCALGPKCRRDCNDTTMAVMGPFLGCQNFGMYMSTRALPRRQPLAQASDSVTDADSDDDEEWLRDDLLSNVGSDLAHAQNTTHTSRPQGAEAHGASTLC